MAHGKIDDLLIKSGVYSIDSYHMLPWVIVAKDPFKYLISQNQDEMGNGLRVNWKETPIFDVNIHGESADFTMEEPPLFPKETNTLTG